MKRRLSSFIFFARATSWDFVLGFGLGMGLVLVLGVLGLSGFGVVAARAAVPAAPASVGAHASGVVDSEAARAPADADANPKRLSDQLTDLRKRVMGLQEGLLAGLKTQQKARANVKKIQELIQLQREERELSKQRLEELERTVKELLFRRELLTERIRTQQIDIRRSLITLDRSLREAWANPQPKTEAIEAPRRRILANLADRGLREIETYRADLSDADQLEVRIQEEKQQLAYLIEDLEEQEGVLELNRQLQADLLRKKVEERLSQLENYRKLKSAESQVEQLIGDFNARLELERTTETERAAARAMTRGIFAQLKGRLPLPIESGKVVSSFGRVFDPASRLYVFKKGIDILPAGAASGERKKMPVRAVSAGKVAYSGTLPDYGNVTIIDHGEHFYTLCANLGELSKSAGEAVAAGDVIGQSDDRGTPIYFEIRARNVAVNPLQWITN